MKLDFQPDKSHEAPATEPSISEQNDAALDSMKQGQKEIIEVDAFKRQLDDDFILKQFETQRTITSLLMNKLKLTEDFVLMVKELHTEMKKVCQSVA